MPGTQNRGSAKLRPRFFLKMILFFTILFILAAVYWANQLLIVISPQLDGQTVTFTTEPGEEMCFSWRHSVHRTMVKEYFRIQGENDFLLFMVKYDSYGVGMPFLPSEGQLVTKHGKFELSMSRPFTAVSLGTGQEAQLEIEYNGENIKLYEKYQPGTFLQITVKKRFKFYLDRFV